MPYKEHIIEKVKFTISEVAEIVGITTSAVKFYEQEFPGFLRSSRNHRNIRVYTKFELEKYKAIHYLRSKGYTTQGIRYKLNLDTFHTNNEMERLIKSLCS